MPRRLVTPMRSRRSCSRVRTLTRTQRDGHSVASRTASDRDPGIERTIDLLVAARLDPNDIDEDGCSPLHGALSADRVRPARAVGAVDCLALEAATPSD